PAPGPVRHLLLLRPGLPQPLARHLERAEPDRPGRPEGPPPRLPRVLRRRLPIDVIKGPLRPQPDPGRRRQVARLPAITFISRPGPSHYFSKKGKSRANSPLVGRRPYSQTSKASAYSTLAARTLPYQPASLSRNRWATARLRAAWSARTLRRRSCCFFGSLGTRSAEPLAPPS